MAGATEMTIAAWFNLTSAPNFERIFDFGTSNTTSSMYLTPTFYNQKPPTWMRFTTRAVRPEGGSYREDLDKLPGDAGVFTIAVGVWRHVAVALDAAGGRLYLDG